jgi:hypothetical protein
MRDRGLQVTAGVGDAERRAADRRQAGQGRRVTVALLIVIAVLMIATGWLLNLATSRPVSAADAAASGAAVASARGLPW